MIGVFLRHSHPAGSGYETIWAGEYGHRAHGYSLIYVECDTDEELAAVKAKLASEGLPEPLGHAWPWYGGQMDHVGTIKATYPDSEAAVELPWKGYGDHLERVSVGDNRFVGVYDVSEILER